jgi:hypothetical protein
MEGICEQSLITQELHELPLGFFEGIGSPPLPIPNGADRYADLFGHFGLQQSETGPQLANAIA